jgi:phage baseplate assembly protein W
MQGYSPKLPLLQSEEDGVYNLNKTILDTARQNLKMLLLTSPGERIMDKNFGVGLKNYIFSQDIRELRSSIESNVLNQVSKYLSYITINEIVFSEPNSNDENILFISIRYSIRTLNTNDELNITI